VNKVV